MKEELIEFGVYLTGHDNDTIEQMYNDWQKYHSFNSLPHNETSNVSSNEHQEKDCFNCKHKNVSYLDFPCRLCGDYELWEQSD